MKAADVKSKIEELHPYRVAGNRDSYCEYNEGWSDACDALFEALRAAGLINESRDIVAGDEVAINNHKGTVKQQHLDNYVGVWWHTIDPKDGHPNYWVCITDLKRSWK